MTAANGPDARATGGRSPRSMNSCAVDVQFIEPSAQMGPTARESHPFIGEDFRFGQLCVGGVQRDNQDGSGASIWMRRGWWACNAGRA